MTRNVSPAVQFYASNGAADDFEPFVVDGRTVGEVHWIRQSPAGANATLLVGLWRGEPGTFPYHFTEDETIYALEGELRIAIDGGQTLTLTPGDVVSFAKGTKSEWTIAASFKKLFVVSG